jgi:hypothetical protein
MQVYVVTAGWDYEGIDCVALYDCKSAADARAASLQHDEGYDWAEVNLQTVHMESALVA